MCLADAVINTVVWQGLYLFNVTLSASCPSCKPTDFQIGVLITERLSSTSMQSVFGPKTWFILIYLTKIALKVQYIIPIQVNVFLISINGYLFYMLWICFEEFIRTVNRVASLVTRVTQDQSFVVYMYLHLTILEKLCRIQHFVGSLDWENKSVWLSLNQAYTMHEKKIYIFFHTVRRCHI